MSENQRHQVGMEFPLLADLSLSGYPLTELPIRAARLTTGSSALLALGGAGSAVINYVEMQGGQNLEDVRQERDGRFGLAGNTLGAIVGTGLAMTVCAGADGAASTTGVGAASWLTFPACVGAVMGAGSTLGGAAGHLLNYLHPMNVDAASNVQADLPNLKQAAVKSK